MGQVKYFYEGEDIVLGISNTKLILVWLFWTRSGNEEKNWYHFQLHREMAVAGWWLHCSLHMSLSSRSSIDHRNALNWSFTWTMMSNFPDIALQKGQKVKDLVKTGKDTKSLCQFEDLLNTPTYIHVCVLILIYWYSFLLHKFSKDCYLEERSNI